uniref:Vacuolar protein-sorting-associated protein 25 n=1 Tax=Glossina palpalis gambiensis TaxID=67801 RepID=A0A1B0C073_9MUSC
MTDFQWPWEYEFPPFFTLQTHEETQKRQLDVWCNLFLKYLKHLNKFRINVNESTFPLYCNESVNRRLSADMILKILTKLQASGHAQQLDKKGNEWLVYWHTLEEYGNTIYEWIQETGQTNTVCTLYEISSGEFTNDKEFHEIDEDVLIKVLRLLEERGKCELIELDGSYGGIKFADIINGIDEVHLSTIRHAAEMSHFISERTTETDKSTNNDSDSESNANVKNDVNKVDKNELNKRKMRTPTNDTEVTSISNSLQNLDFKTIKSSIMLREAEAQRKRTVRREILEMQERHTSLIRQQLKPLQQQNQEEHRKWLEQKRRGDSQILEMAEQQSSKEQQEHDRQLETLRKQTQRQLQLISFQGISQYQLSFRSKYETIAQLLMSLDKQALLSCAEYNRKLRELTQMFEQLIGRIKSGDCGPTELKTAENLCKSLEALEGSIIEACRQEQNKQTEQKQREQEQQQLQKDEENKAFAISQSAKREELVKLEQQPQAQQQQTPEPSQEPKPSSTNTAESPVTSTDQLNSSPKKLVRSGRLEFYAKINNFYLEKVEKVKVLQSDESMKKYRSDCQKSINIPVNSISAVSQQHIRDKFDKLFSFIMAQSNSNLGYDYCLLLMAKKFVGQGETTVSSNPNAAFPIASVIVSLWKQIPEFGQLFLAYIYKESPFLVPCFVPQKKGQSWEEYAKTLGYRFTEGQMEQQDMFLKRQAGIARLYAAVMITSGRKQDGPSHPYSLDNAWRWLTNFVDLDPFPDICATLMMEILQIVGNDLWLTYGKQFVKLLVYIQYNYFPKLTAMEKDGGPKARLELLLRKFLTEGKVSRPSGILPADFW